MFYIICTFVFLIQPFYYFASCSYVKKMASQTENTMNDVFKGTQDRYNGITVESVNEQCSTELFPKKLEGLLII